MALIIKCRACRKRIKDDAPCACGCFERHFTVDYWPDGRHGRRLRRHLPDELSLQEARDLAEIIRKTARKKPDALAGIAPMATVDGLFPDYLAWYEIRRARTTYRDMDMAFNNHLQEAFGKFPIKDIGPAHIELYQRTRRATGVSNRTVNKELDYFSGFLRWCRKERKMDIEKVNINKLPYNRPLLFSRSAMACDS